MIFILLLVFRTRLLQYAVDKVIAKVEAKYPAELTIKEAKFDDINTVVMSGISFVPHKRDTLFTTDSVRAQISIRSLFKGRVIFKEFSVSHVNLTAIKRDSLTNNYSFLFKKDDKQPADTVQQGRNYGQLLNRLIETAFENVPDQVNFQDMNVQYLSPNRTINMHMPALLVDDGHINTTLTLQTDSLVNRMLVKGVIDPGKYMISASLYTEDTAGIRLPYIKEKFNAELSFDTLHLSLTDKEFKKDVLTIRGEARANDVVVNQPKIAAENVGVKYGAVKYKVSVGRDYYSVDSLTEVTINKVKIYPQLSYQKDTSSKVNMVVRMPKTPANDFFESLPEGMFENFEGIKAKGSLSYNMHFYVDLAQVDSLKFDSDLEGHNFEILEYGKTDFTMLNRPFSHTVYEYGKPVRTFTVGPSNPFFTPIGQISPYLRSAILTTEDAGFYRHKGFHEEAWRQSLVTNIKEKKFVRGGSTISMQLVKNVFLTRKKTLARKVEEALIVWLIENYNLSTKSRMYEVYLNIIEWGPEIYGVKDASRFYFAKQPSELSLAESIFLTYIIPKPKAYRSAFTASGHLRPGLSRYYRFISGIMLRRGLISREDYDSLQADVYLDGRARDIIVTEPEIQVVPDDEEEQNIDIFIQELENKEARKEEEEKKKKSLFERLFKRKD